MTLPANCTTFQLTAARRRLLTFNVLIEDYDQFQLTAARRRLRKGGRGGGNYGQFQLTAARRRLLVPDFVPKMGLFVSTHSRPKAAAKLPDHLRGLGIVSTHSRPKAAAFCCAGMPRRRRGFNSQPPEGGCHPYILNLYLSHCFNSQPPEGGCLPQVSWHLRMPMFQLTAARRRLLAFFLAVSSKPVFQLTAARRRLPSGGSYG